MLDRHLTRVDPRPLLFALRYAQRSPAISSRANASRTSPGGSGISSPSLSTRTTLNQRGSSRNSQRTWATNSTGKRAGESSQLSYPSTLIHVHSRSIEELGAPDFKRNASTDLICQRAAERERSRVASQNAKPGTIKRMQFTFSVDQPTPAGPNLVSKPDLKPSAEFKEASSRRGRQTSRALVAGDESYDTASADLLTTKDYSASYGSRKRKSPSSSQLQPALRFPTLFSTDFGPSALLSVSPSLSTPMNYGEDVTNSSSSYSLSILRPTIELPLDELLSSVDSPEEIRTTPFQPQPQNDHRAGCDNDIVMRDSQPGEYISCVHSEKSHQHEVSSSPQGAPSSCPTACCAH